jgi:hypothetical protein
MDSNNGGACGRWYSMRSMGCMGWGFGRILGVGESFLAILDLRWVMALI